ncbi:helix-turn-helix transcriptional regulator [Chitinophaga sp. 212800010-3]|uniref:helix-turn-helix domain-containing protein n=1 Tax=unclassified Chitinophaga TaxID=2619133 RepID=UPI002DF21184|nr:AraC-like DNA-binding protein [Chitinophaga sp. 212800010-3]
MKSQRHIPVLNTISDFYNTFRIGTAQNDFFTIMRIEDQAKGKLLYMPLFRGNFFRLVFCKTPGIRFLLPDQTIETSKNSLYFTWPGKIESWQRVELVHGFLCCFTPAFAGIDMLHPSFEKEFPFLTAEADTIIRLTEKEAAELTHTAEIMLEEMNSDHPDKFDILQHLLRVYLIRIRRMYYRKVAAKSAVQLNHATIMNRFRSRVNEYFTQLSSGKAKAKPGVSTIARMMNMNASYLNSIVRQYSGRTASSFIHEKLILEAKSYLMHTPLQVAEIAYLLQFNDVPYFTRFFKRMTGATPGVFRNEALKKFDPGFQGNRDL